MDVVAWKLVAIVLPVEDGMDSRHENSRAFQLSIKDSAMRAYLQRYPFVLGPDSTMNARCTEEIRQQFALRPNSNGLATVGGKSTTVRLSPEQANLSENVLSRLQTLMDQAGVHNERRSSVIEDFGWEAKLTPSGPKDVLVIGCGDGIELLFLRAVLPDANLTAVDYGDHLTQALKQTTQVQFHAGDMTTILGSFTEKFDLVFSNHTLEHMYMPDEIIAVLSGLLRENGTLVSTLPMDAAEGSPFLDKLTGIAKEKNVHPVDLVYLDTGHPWKTNPSDLRQTFQAAGFRNVELYQRAEHLPRWFAGSEKQLQSRRDLDLKLHALFFGMPRTVIKALFSRPPVILVRLLLAAERRVWFGANKVKNLYTEEVCVIAHKQA